MKKFKNNFILNKKLLFLLYTPRFKCLAADGITLKQQMIIILNAHVL